MKSTLTLLLLIIASPLFGQEVDFVEYDLENGLHVILHQDNKAPVVVTSILYHVGSKDEKEDRTGFAHFFEHLLFEGTQNIEVISQKNNKRQAITELKMMGNVMQKQVVNKDKAFMEMQDQKIDFEGQTLEDMIQIAALFPELNFDLNSLEFKGIVDVDEKKAYEIKISETKSNFYDTSTFYKIQTIQTQEIMGNSQTSTVKFGDFKQVNGIYFPHTTTLSMGPQAIDFKSTGIELNTTIDASLFE